MSSACQVKPQKTKEHRFQHEGMPVGTSSDAAGDCDPATPNVAVQRGSSPPTEVQSTHRAQDPMKLLQSTEAFVPTRHPGQQQPLHNSFGTACSLCSEDSKARVG